MGHVFIINQFLIAYSIQNQNEKAWTTSYVTKDTHEYSY